MGFSFTGTSAKAMLEVSSATVGGSSGTVLGISGLNVEVKLEHHNHKLNPFHMNRKNIKYRHLLERDYRREDFQDAYNIVAEGKFPIAKMITHRVGLDDLHWALDLTHKHLDECIKIIVYPRKEA